MFNKSLFYTQSSKEYVPYEKTVIEKRAPTDDSIRLYEEIKTKAYKSILDTIKINDNTFNVKAIIFDEPLSYKRICKFAFTINGFEITDSIDIDIAMEYNKEEVINLIIDKCSKKLSVEMLKRIKNF